MPFSAWLDIRLVRKFLLKNNYTLIRLIDILREYLDYSGTNKEIQTNLNCTEYFLYIKFAYKDETELKRIIDQIFNMLLFMSQEYKNPKYKISTFALCKSYMPWQNSAEYYREKNVARRILSKLLYELNLIEFTN